MQGYVKTLVLEKKYGFISRQGGFKGVFFHASAVDPQLGFDERLLEREVEFEIVQSDRGRPRAEGVRAIMKAG